MGERTAIPTEPKVARQSSSLASLALPASWAYRAALRIRNQRYDKGTGVESVDRPVISIGNITMGGTGKSPLVAWAAKALLDTGHKPVIAMRGYRSRSGEQGDEEQEYRQRLGQSASIVASPRRAAALRSYLATPEGAGRDCVILDDGFQHRQLARTLDLVLIDATQNTFDDRVVPAGRLREPLENLRRADGIIITRAESVDSSLSHLVERYHGRAPLAWLKHVWTHLDLAGPETGSADLSWLASKRIVTMFGVGNPEPVEQQVRSTGASIRRRIPVRDHQHYTEQFLNGELKTACADRWIDALVVTPKDWVKLRPMLDWSRWPATVVIPRLEIEFLDGESDLKARIMSAVGSAIRHDDTERHMDPVSTAPDS